MHDFCTYLVSILDRQDKMSMATSIEARVPFLDNEIIDLARSLPLAYRQTMRHRKRVLKAVALRYLPTEIVERRKSGFGVPLPAWLAANGPMGRLLDVASDTVIRAGFVNADRLKRVIDEHRAREQDRSEVLWPIINLAIWLDEFRLV
jgi:asparagine synthase (glutamine-hydrolysing)